MLNWKLAPHTGKQYLDSKALAVANALYILTLVILCKICDEWLFAKCCHCNNINPSVSLKPCLNRNSRQEVVCNAVQGFEGPQRNRQAAGSTLN